MKSNERNRGFVSLLTAILLSMLLIIITVSMITIEALQLRKAEDAEQTLRAYYTAEAGVEDAVAKVLSDVITPGHGDNVCNSLTNYDIPGDQGWTCQLVTFSGNPTGRLTAPDSAVTINPGKAAYQSVIIEWNQSTSGAGYNVALPFPDQNTYTANYSAPPLELAIVQYPDASFAAGNPGLTLENLLAVPGGGAGGAVSYSAANFTSAGPYKANCAPLAGRTLPAALGGGVLDYNCYAVLNNLNTSNFDYLFRVRSRYMPTQYSMIFKSGATGGGAIVPVPDGMATIDVTARAGQTYRRVISNLDLTAGAEASLNYVIYSDTDVCKDFDVIDNVAQPGCPY
jgi:hypothetical protein